MYMEIQDGRAPRVAIGDTQVPFPVAVFVTRQLRHWRDVGVLVKLTLQFGVYENRDVVILTVLDRVLGRAPADTWMIQVYVSRRAAAFVSTPDFPLS
jgi:hypothetical protein